MLTTSASAFQALLANKLHFLAQFKLVFCHQNQYTMISLQSLYLNNLQNRCNISIKAAQTCVHWFY